MAFTVPLVELAPFTEKQMSFVVLSVPSPVATVASWMVPPVKHNCGRAPLVPSRMVPVSLVSVLLFGAVRALPVPMPTVDEPNSEIVPVSNEIAVVGEHVPVFAVGMWMEIDPEDPSVPAGENVRVPLAPHRAA